MFVALASIVNELFILNLDDTYVDAHVYNISAKRFRPHDLNPIYAWHYRLDPISENA